MEIKQKLVSSSKYSVKCPYSMTPIGICIHNTANDASAANEISYMISNNNEVSFHIAVDDKEAIQGIPFNRNAWHAGDGGSGTGNRKYIAIEICYSKSGGTRFTNAEKNAAMRREAAIKKLSHQHKTLLCAQKSDFLSLIHIFDCFSNHVDGRARATLQGMMHHAGTGNADIDDAFRFAHAMISAGHEGIILHRVGKDDQFGAGHAAGGRAQRRRFLDAPAHFRNRVHIDACTGGGHIDAGAKPLCRGQ